MSRSWKCEVRLKSVSDVSFAPHPTLPQPLRSEGPVNMENLPVNNGNGQSYGYTLYETAIGNSGGTLDAMKHVRDRALVRT